MKYPIFLCFYIFCFVKSVTINKYSRFLKNKSIHSVFNDIIKQELKSPIIFNGVKTPLKKDFCKIISELNDIPFKEYTFDYFMMNHPHVNNKNSILFVNDFLVGHGRILNHYEENILLNLNKNSNLIVFQSDDIKSISFKDNNIIRHFPIINFPEINKKEIIQYIYDIITLNKYNDDLYNLNWIKYDIEKLNFEKINMLLYELNNITKKNLDNLDNSININEMIESFHSLNNINLN